MTSNKYKFQSHYKKIEDPVNTDFYSLYKIIGFGSKNNFSITKNDINGLIAWIAGPYVIFYDIPTDSQVFFLKNKNNKVFTSIRFSNNGKFLTTGEGNCKNGEIYLYQINKIGKKYNCRLILSYINHLYGIDKLFFFKADKFILSIGDKEDRLINVMDIENKKIILTYKFNNNILGADIFNNSAVICGNNFIRIYELEFTELNIKKNSNNLFIKKSVDLSKLKDKNFIYVSIYINKITKKEKIFFLTEDCYLAEMLPNKFTLNRWINLKVQTCFNLEIWGDKIGIGCGDGIYRIFNANDLTYIQNLPKPPPLGQYSVNPNIDYPKNNYLTYPDIKCNIYSNYYNKLITVYNNNYFFVWDISNINKIEIITHHIFQNGSIKNMDLAIDKKEGIIKMVTNGDDKTVIFWNFKINDFLQNYNNNIFFNNNSNYHQNIKYIFYLSKNYEHFQYKKQSSLLSKNNSLNEKPNDENVDLTAIKFSTDLQYLLIADSIGNLKIFSLGNNYNQIKEIHAHNGKINCIDTILLENNHNEKCQTFLATGSSDNYLNIYDSQSNFINIKTKKDFNIISEKMSSEIINILFYQDPNSNLKIMVSEINSTITIFKVDKGFLQNLQKFYEPNIKTYSLSYNPMVNKIISGHNGKILIWKTNCDQVYKNFEVSKGDKILDNLKVTGDSEGIIFATSNDDNNIRIRALYNGKLLCKIELAESITNLAFILNNNFLISTSSEGYIYFFKINQDLISKLKSDKKLINSIEEKNVINNKLKFLQKLMENDVSTSRNEKIKNILEKFHEGEEANFNDLNKLDELVIESKSRINSIKYRDDIKQKEENEINNDKKDNINNVEILEQKKLFELKIKDNNIRKEKKHYKNVKKISINDSFRNIENNISNREKIKKRNTVNNNVTYINSDIKLKSFGSNNKKLISPIKLNIANKINQTENKVSLYKHIDFKSVLKPNDIKFMKLNNSEKYKNKIKHIYISDNIRFSILKKNKNKNMNFQIVKHALNYKNVNCKYNIKDIIIKQINNININNIHKKSDLILLEKKLQILKNKIKTKLNLPVENEEKEKILDTFGVLLIDRINKAKKNYK